MLLSSLSVHKKNKQLKHVHVCVSGKSRHGASYLHKLQLLI